MPRCFALDGCLPDGKQHYVRLQHQPNRGDNNSCFYTALLFLKQGASLGGASQVNSAYRNLLAKQDTTANDLHEFAALQHGNIHKVVSTLKERLLWTRRKSKPGVLLLTDKYETFSMYALQ
jgi:hypothetical protein